MGAQAVYGILFLTLFMLRRINERVGRPDKLDALYALFILTIVLDAIWMYIDGIPSLRAANIILEVVDISAVALASYLWFLYMLDFLPVKETALYKHRFLLSIPMYTQLLLIVTSVWTGLIFTVDEGGTYIRGPIHTYIVVVNYLYMLLGSFAALRSRREALLTMDRNRYTAAALFPIPVLLFSLTQMMLPPGFPGIQGGVLVSLLVLYGILQNTRVTQDHLTGLPNRFAFEQDLLGRIRRQQAGAETRLFLLEGDLDKFKHINDTHGHPVGDLALSEGAQALNQVFSDRGAAVFRTGGDEFMMIAESEEGIDLDALQKALNEKLKEVAASHGIELSMTLGMKEYDGKMSLREFIAEVDQQLYAAKDVEPQASATVA